MHKILEERMQSARRKEKCQKCGVLWSIDTDMATHRHDNFKKLWCHTDSKMRFPYMYDL